MKKRNSGHLLALTAVCGLLLAGCGGSEHVIQGDNTGAVSEEGKDVPGSAVPEAGRKDDGGNAGYVFVNGGVAVAMDADAAPLTEALGEPLSYYEAASCAFEGLDKIYTYSGFEIETYPLDGKDYVSVVVLKDDSVATQEGVAIGDSREKVEEKYGTEYQENGSQITYGKDGMRLNFILDGGQVVSIQYQSGVLD